MEFINLRVKAVGRNPQMTLPRETSSPSPLPEALKEKRSVYFREKGPVEIPIYERSRIGCGTRIPGPCIIEEEISTTLIPFGSRGVIDAYKNIAITLEDI